MTLDVQSLIEINKFICSEYNNAHGIKDKNLLNSLVDSIDQEVFGEKLYSTFEDKLSFLIASIVKNHCFVDGNKRTAVLVFYSICEHEQHTNTLGENQLFDSIIKIAENKFNLKNTKILLELKN